MSSLPLILSLADDFDRLSVSPVYFDPLSMTNFYRWPSSLSSQLSCLGKNREANTIESLHIGKDGFQVCMEVGQFKPNELNVKVVENSIVVEGKHEEREDDHGFISRHFVRRYALPKSYEADKVLSTLSSDGVLTVSIPKPAQLEDKMNERVIPIQQTGPAHLIVKENTKEDEKKEAGEKAKS